MIRIAFEVKVLFQSTILIISICDDFINRLFEYWIFMNLKLVAPPPLKLCEEPLDNLIFPSAILIRCFPTIPRKLFPILLPALPVALAAADHTPAL